MKTKKHFPLRPFFPVKRLFWLLPFGLPVLFSTGCKLLDAQVDPTRFYVLSTPAASAAVTPPTDAPAVHVRPVELASYIRARPMIVRKGDNEIEFREFARWGEPLEQGIARVIREELLARGAVSAVAISGVRAANRPFDCELTVRVLTCEGTADGEVKFRAVWELSVMGEKKVPPAARGDFHPADLKWDGKTDGNLAALLSQAVVGLAAEIAAALPKK